MRYLFINSVYGIRSTGRIVSSQCHGLTEEGHECLAAYGRAADSDGIRTIRIGTKKDYLLHAAAARLMDNQGEGSRKATERLIRQAEAFRPDIIWLHNLHGYYINYEILFSWIKMHPEMKIMWTLHDCWAFTGHCVHFTMAKCEKWKTHCRYCPQKRTYPCSVLADRSESNYSRKRAAFTGVRNMTIITPSEWLAGLVKESFLGGYRVQVIHNTIDPAVFHSTPGNFRQQYGLEGKHIALGVAVGWEETKGLNDLYQLRERLDDGWMIVLVGLTKKQIRKLPEGMIGIERTENRKQLAEIYTAADVFVNPTHQDTYPTVNLEARACGTPVVTYDVGGSPESAGYEHVVQEGDIAGMADEIRKISDKT